MAIESLISSYLVSFLLKGKVEEQSIKKKVIDIPSGLLLPLGFISSSVKVNRDDRTEFPGGSCC